MELLTPHGFNGLFSPTILPLYIKSGSFEIRLHKRGERVKRKALIEEILNRERYASKHEQA